MHGEQSLFFMKMEKIQKPFIDHGFGFPVKLFHVPMIKVRGIWTPNIGYNRLSKAVLKALCEKSARLTGNEIRFIRLHFEMTLQGFAKRFSVSHVAVIKWEATKNHPTPMNWATEKDIRLFLLSKISSEPRDLASLYRRLEDRKEEKNKPLQLDLERLAA